ncbi:ribonuclease pancreatic B-like [Trichosurus vulpecula]|uniref:ribonuclease pancreatic B-like n=1 Tax=Trichosurus vulpecula TaxID=9337 RepID=UPI00186AF9E1|nr:ribonuclease pancreatic B-like [Trichosurus vulpecula]
MSHVMMWTFFLFLLLDLTNFSHTYDFWKHHMDYPMTKVSGSSNLYRNVITQQRELFKNGTCRLANTFIHESTPYIESLCYNVPVPCKIRRRRKCHQSPNLVRVTDCFNISDNQPPNCQYRTKFNYRKIRVICENDRPVHLDS